jgi:hypothetical protein
MPNKTNNDSQTPLDRPHPFRDDLHDRVRNWDREKSHYARDTTWREDAHQAHPGSGPQVMATLRNLAAALLRLNGHHAIKKATEAICRERTRVLSLLAT